MSKSSKAHDRRSSKRSKPTQRSNDGGAYIVIVMIGAFGMLLWWAAGQDWHHALLGYLVAVALLVNVAAIRAYLGHDLSGFQRALAHLPLRCVSYGTRKGRPIQQARGAANALRMILVSVITSVMVLVLLGWLLL